MANEISIPETGNLHKVIEFVERMSDKIDGMEKEAAEKVAVKTEELHARTAELGTQSASFAAELEGLKAERDAISEGKQVADAKLAALEARCDALDAALPAGEKSFIAASSAQHASAVTLGGAITAARRFARGEAIPEAYARAGLQDQTTTAKGGVLVPVEKHGEIIKGVFERSLPRQLCRIIPMNSDTMDIATVSSPPTVSVRTGAQEGTSGGIADSTITFGSPTLQAVTFVAIDKVSKELDEDSLIAMEPLLGDLFAEAVAEAENAEFLNGTGAITGIVTDATAGIVDTSFSADSADQFNEVAYDDLTALMFSIDSGAISNGTFIISQSNFQHVLNLRDGSGGVGLGAPIFQNLGTGTMAGSSGSMPNSGAMVPGFLLGRPLYLSSKMPVLGTTTDDTTVFAIYGDFSKYAMGDRRALEITWDDSVYAAELNRACIVSERVGFKMLIGSSFGRLKTDAHA